MAPSTSDKTEPPLGVTGVSNPSGLREAVKSASSTTDFDRGPENIATATDALRISGGDSNTASPEMRTNFPLPRELRDQIYGHLLYHEHVRDEPYYITRKNKATDEDTGKDTDRKLATNSLGNGRVANNAHTYRFETAILAVNHQIHDEATELLVSNNFVVISFEWAGLGLIKHVQDVPLVTENQKAVSKFTMHHLRVHIKANSKDLSQVPTHSFLMVASDLPCFCRTMQWEFFHMRAKGRAVIQRIEEDPKNGYMSFEYDEGYNGRAVSTKIQLRSIPAKPMSAALQATLLKPFENMTILTQNVKLMDLASHDLSVTVLQKRMSPKVVFVKPMVWRALELAQDLKRMGEEMILRNLSTRAYLKYQALIFAMKDCRLLNFNRLAYLYTDIEAPIVVLHQTILDGALTASFSRLKFGATRDCNDMLSAALPSIRFLSTASMQSGQKNATILAINWFGVLLTIVEFDAQHLPTRRGDLADVLRTIDADQYPVLAERISHDLCVVDRILAKRSVSSFQSSTCSSEPFNLHPQIQAQNSSISVTHT
jgi:hypothetical protein